VFEEWGLPYALRMLGLAMKEQKATESLAT
jgi:hypothetical protein